MINVIGLGNAGCAIAELLGEYPPYKIFKVDVGIPKAKNNFSITKRNSPEEYESKFPERVINALKKIEGRAVLIVAGGGKISSASLRILEAVQHVPTEVVYIRPDRSSISKSAMTMDNVTFNVFQEYARSGVIERLLLLSNSSVEEGVGNIPVAHYYPRLNSIIASTYHMTNVYSNSDAVFASPIDESGICRIGTLGIGTMANVTDRLFFPLDYISEKTYFFAINEKQLDEDAALLGRIKLRVKQDDTTIKAGFGVYATPYEENYIYLLTNTKIIQGVNYDE